MNNCFTCYLLDSKCIDIKNCEKMENPIDELKELKAQLISDDYASWCYYVLTVEKTINILSSIRWISVNDSLPEEGKYVLAYTDTKVFNPTKEVITRYTKYGFEGAANITHWMELPKLPQQ